MENQMDLIPLLIDSVSIFPAIEVPNISPDLKGPFTGAAMRLVNLAAGLATIACLLGVVIAALLLAFGNLSERNKSRSWVILASCLVGVMILGSATALMTWVGGIPLI